MADTDGSPETLAKAPPFGGRLEDLRLVTGLGRFIADARPPGCLIAYFLRADIACGAIGKLAVAAAKRVPGVADIVTHADLAAAGIAPFGHEDFPRDDGGEAVVQPMPLLCDGAIRHLGEPIAMILAESEVAALDAAETIEVETVQHDPPDQIVFLRRYNDREAVEKALQGAAHRVSATVSLPRMLAAPLECRGTLAVPQTNGSLQVCSSTQSPFALQRGLCSHFGWRRDEIRVTAGDVGGSFGLKGAVTREDALVCWAARRLGRPVCWIATRSEAFIGDHQARGARGRLTLGLDEELRFVALDAAFTVDVGAYPARRAFGLMNNLAGITGIYDIPLVSAELQGRISARAPLAPFRGNGRPEATYAIESAIDAAARGLNCDPVDLRRRNLIRPEALPLRTALGFGFDCGNFPALLEAATVKAGLDRLPARRAAAAARGRLLGFGFTTNIESAGGPVSQPRPDFARIVISQEGRVKIAPGVMSVGQGHETAMSRMAAEVLEIDLDLIDYVNGDTAAVVDGRGSGGSAGIVVAGSAMRLALDQVIAEGRIRTARHFGRSVDEVSFRAGAFRVAATNLTSSLGEIAATSGRDGEWTVETEFCPAAATFPNGAHACEVEIDPETGALEITRYTAVLDVGRVHHPELVAGQLHGGIAMGLAQGIGERVIYDDSGQVLTGTLMDYFVPRAADLPSFSLQTIEVPTKLNPLGAKGVGEAGTVGATAVIMSAVRDALARAGVADFDMPATPCRIWEALQAARASQV